MTLGVAERQGNLLDDVNNFCEQALQKGSIYTVLHRERDRLFPDEMFADLFSDQGRRSVPPSVVATVMVLQRLEGLSDREAAERFAFDTRFRYAAGVGGYDSDGWGRFAHTVLVDMRARLAMSKSPRRIFEATVEVAKDAGLVGAKRVLDSTPLYDAVATMDTITLIRSAIRGLLRVADLELRAELSAVLTSGDDYASNAKPQIAWDDAAEREALVDSRAKDAYACLVVLDGRELTAECSQAAALLATVVGQDLDEGADGVFRIARRVAKDRVISTVDPEARHGHKTTARGFDGYKGHVSIDPDSEIITDTVVSAGNAGDASVATELIDDLVGDQDTKPDEAPADEAPADEAPVDVQADEAPVDEGPVEEPADEAPADELSEQGPALDLTPPAPARRAGTTSGGSRRRRAKADKAAANGARAARRAAGTARRAARRAEAAAYAARMQGVDQRKGALRPPDCLRGRRLRRRRAARLSRPQRHRPTLQDPATGRARRHVRKGPVPHRPRGRHGHLPCRGNRLDPPGRERRRDRLFLGLVRELPSPLGLHERRRRAHHPGRPPRATSRRCPPRPKGPGLGRRLPGDEAEGGAQARPPDAAQARRPESTRAREVQGRRRLQPPRRGTEHRPPGEARAHLDHLGMGGSGVVSAARPPQLAAGS
jgi:hypothetical protein